ncbi:hypothetical protein B0H14DRAFT_3869951 [Mycena olivaceomarginata]|nr:hypothetical protein B0H14DRAFT_3869951 [Mycena olivaceomarginata]
MPTAKFAYVFLFPSTMSVHGHGGDSLRRQLLQQLGPSSSGIPTHFPSSQASLSHSRSWSSSSSSVGAPTRSYMSSPSMDSGSLGSDDNVKPYNYGSYWYTCIVGGVVGAVYAVDVGGMTAEYALHWKALTDEKCPSALLKTYDTYSKELKCIQEILE